MSRLGLPAMALVSVLALAACGGNGGSSSPGNGAASAPPAASPSPAASQDAGASAPPAASAAASAAPSSDGGGASVACDLVTAEEAAGILGVASTTTESIPGEPSYCMYQDPDGGAVLATSYATSGGGTVYAVYKDEDGATLVEGIGDGAVFSPSTNTLFVLKGDTMVGITAGAGGTDPETRLGFSKQVAEIAVGRM